MLFLVKPILNTVTGWFTGGALDRILDTIENKLDNEVTKEQVKADVTKAYVEAKTKLLVGRAYYFQAVFVLPLGIHWAALNFVSAFPQWGWTVHPLPDPFDEWAAYIVSALFIVEGGKTLIDRFKR